MDAFEVSAGLRTGIWAGVFLYAVGHSHRLGAMVGALGIVNASALFFGNETVFAVLSIPSACLVGYLVIDRCRWRRSLRVPPPMSATLRPVTPRPRAKAPV